MRTALSSEGCPKVLPASLVVLNKIISKLTLFQFRLPVFGAALGTSVLDCPSKALAYFAPREVVDVETMRIKAIGPNGSTQTLTFCSNFKIQSVILMSKKAFRIPYIYECEMYVDASRGTVSTTKKCPLAGINLVISKYWTCNQMPDSY